MGFFRVICHKIESNIPAQALIQALLHVNISSGVHIKFLSKCSFVD